MPLQPEVSLQVGSPARHPREFLGIVFLVGHVTMITLLVVPTSRVWVAGGIDAFWQGQWGPAVVMGAMVAVALALLGLSK